VEKPHPLEIMERGEAKGIITALGLISAAMAFVFLCLSFWLNNQLGASPSHVAWHWRRDLDFLSSVFAGMALIIMALFCLKRSRSRRHFRWKQLLILFPLFASCLAVWSDRYIINSSDYFFASLTWVPITAATMAWLASPLLRHEGWPRLLTAIFLVLPTLLLLRLFLSFFLPRPSPY
jgi:hypothetical protein